MDMGLGCLLGLPASHGAGTRLGLTSVCSAHPLVIEAAFHEAMETGTAVCIEATCNQVNQDGGYTGMTPADFRAFVVTIAADCGFAPDRILFGGDHLGPNPWRKGPAAAAMEKAERMTYAYAAAGFSKIHLDASMSCADDPVPLGDEVIAARAARLARAAEDGAASQGHPPPAYIVGTEVPVPGGATEALDTLDITAPDSAAQTLAYHQTAFANAGIADAFGRVVAMVVQPGVEFGHTDVIAFAPQKATGLAAWRDGQSHVVFEAHSTDYQTAEALASLVKGGFAILKVGPGLTFALREALYGLDQIAGILVGDYTAGDLPAAMEALMQADPSDWQAYYHGTPATQYLQRHYSYSDRIRYYWNRPEAAKAVDSLTNALADVEIPAPLISQFLSRHYAQVVAGEVAPRVKPLVIAAVRAALAPYSAACSTQQED